MIGSEAISYYDAVGQQVVGIDNSIRAVFFGPSHDKAAEIPLLDFEVNALGTMHLLEAALRKQVHDNIHSYNVIQLFEERRKNRRRGEVYNLGGGRENSLSVLETMQAIEHGLGRPLRWVYVEKARKGDPVWYILDLRKIQSHFSYWKITRTLDDILKEMLEAEVRTSSCPSELND